MRDIRPNTPPGGQLPQLPESELPKLPLTRPATAKLPAGKRTPRPVSEITKQPRLTGSAVPVTPVHVPSPAKEQSFRRRTTAPSRPSGSFKAQPLASKKAAPRTISRIRVGPRERKIAVVAALLLIVAAGLAAAIFLPKAEVRLVLRTAPLLVDERLTIRAENATGDNVVPGSSFFREVPVEDTASVTSTEVVGTKARGTLQLVNRTTEEQKIKEQSRLVTSDGALFFMLRSATLPPSTGTPTRASVEVEAAEAGVAGNIAPQRLNFAALDSSSQTLVYAEATTALSGGSGETVSVVKEADLAAARTAAGEAAKAKVEQEIREELPRGWTILEESWVTEVADFTTEAAIDQRQPTIPYKARVTVRVIGYEQAKLEQQLKAALEQRLDQDFMLFPGPISYAKTVEDVNWEASEATLAARVTHTTMPRLSLETLREKLAGRSEAEAKSYLEGLPGVRSVALDLSPFWVRSIPRIEQRIVLDLQPERQP